MKKVIYQLFIMLGVLTATASCGDFLEDYSQDVDYIRSWKDLDELLIGDCYLSAEPSDGFYYHPNYAQFLHLIADEVEENNCAHNGTSTSYDHHPAEFGYYTWQQRVGINETYTGFATENTTWTKIYKCINIANNVLFSIDKVPQNVQETYDLILSDLQAAEEAFGKVKTEKKSIYRADLTAVYLLLSRVHLYMQNWQKAAEYAQKAINRHARLVDLNTNTDKFMLKTNAENIFSMGGDDLPVMLVYYYQGLRVSKSQYDIYTNNDLRRSQWLWKSGPFQGLTMREMTRSYNPLPATTEPSYYWYAYSEGLRGYIPEVSSVFWMRSAEAYLNLAEAEAAELNITSSGSQLVRDIRLERRKELMLQGHRWFDLRRYRVCSVEPEKISITHDYTIYAGRGEREVKETHRFVLTQDDASWTLPIPNEVLEYNTDMQNNGNQWREYTVVPTSE